MPRERGGGRRVRRVGRRADPGGIVARVIRRHYDGGRPGRRIGLRGDTTRAPSQGPRPKEGRHDAALSFPFGIGTKAANRCRLIKRAVYLISQPRFLHFTLNQHNYSGPCAPNLASGCLIILSNSVDRWSRDNRGQPPLQVLALVVEL